MNNRRTLYLTESTFDFFQVNPESKLISKYEENLQPGDYHTSLGDLSVDQIIKLSRQFDCIQFESQGFDTTSTVYKESLTLFRYLTTNTTSTTHEIEEFTDHSQIKNRPDQPVLWVFGCSHSHGVGLRPGELRYGEWLAQHLDLPLKLITKPGSSLNWSHRHLFNAALKPQDIVVWQLTTPGRISQFNGKHVKEIVLNGSKNRVLVDSISNEQLYFNQLNLLNTGMKFLKLIGCRAVITSITDFGYNYYDYVSEYVKYPEYCSSYGLYLDRGTDGMHAGPLSHKAIAERILKHLQLHHD